MTMTPDCLRTSQRVTENAEPERLAADFDRYRSRASINDEAEQTEFFQRYGYWPDEQPEGKPQPAVEVETTCISCGALVWDGGEWGMCRVCVRGEPS